MMKILEVLSESLTFMTSKLDTLRILVIEKNGDVQILIYWNLLKPPKEEILNIKLRLFAYKKHMKQ